MRRPRATDEQPEQRRRGKRESGVICETDRQESKTKRRGRAPEPEVLMQHVQYSDEQGGHGRSHGPATVLHTRGVDPVRAWLLVVGCWSEAEADAPVQSNRLSVRSCFA